MQAGLFSAVVTSFVVDAYKSLSQDSGDVSVQLLAQISSQLSSFSLTGSAMNSTIAPLSLQDITSGFKPGRTAVNVSTLWFLSLTLSLLAALYAIAVQQWLRQLKLSSGLRPRLAVELLQRRRRALREWHVPLIISWLPIFLQAAVVLFLVGLLFQLHSLDDTVATAFTVVASSGMLIFAGLEMMALFLIGCAYKSPLVPIIVASCAAFTGPATAAIRGAALGLEKGCELLVRCKLMASKFRDRSVVPWIDKIRQTPLHRWMFVGIHQFWINREMDVALRAKNLNELGFEGLFQVLSSADRSLFDIAKTCLHDFPATYAVHDILSDTVIKNLGFKHWRNILSDSGEVTGHPKLHERAQNWISPQRARAMLAAWSFGGPSRPSRKPPAKRTKFEQSKSDKSKPEESENFYISRTLLLTHQATRSTAASLRSVFCGILWNFQNTQDWLNSTIPRAETYIPTLLVFENRRLYAWTSTSSSPIFDLK